MLGVCCIKFIFMRIASGSTRCGTQCATLFMRSLVFSPAVCDSHCTLMVSFEKCATFKLKFKFIVGECENVLAILVVVCKHVVTGVSAV